MYVKSLKYYSVLPPCEIFTGGDGGSKLSITVMPWGIEIALL
jgi:hypothetical protein